jgi:hypothetical protein
MQAAYGRSGLSATSFFTYVGLGLGFLASSLSLPFGVYVLICQRNPEKFIQVQPADWPLRMSCGLASNFPVKLSSSSCCNAQAGRVRCKLQGPSVCLRRIPSPRLGLCARGWQLRPLLWPCSFYFPTLQRPPTLCQLQRLASTCEHAGGTSTLLHMAGFCRKQLIFIFDVEVWSEKECAQLRC